MSSSSIPIILTSTSTTTTTIDTARFTCNDHCGLIAAVIGSICYGTYGVPLKLTANVVVDCHPLVLQTYKTTICFGLCWIALLFETNLQWTPYYGIVAGFLWVTGGSFGCAAVLYAGIATAVGTWASCMILVNFVWGILIFHEPVQSFMGTISAFCLLTLGLIGMTKYSSPTITTTTHRSSSTSSLSTDIDSSSKLKRLDNDDDDIHDNHTSVELQPMMILEKHDKKQQPRRLINRLPSNNETTDGKRGKSDSDCCNKDDTNNVVDNPHHYHHTDEEKTTNSIIIDDNDDDDDDVVLGKSLGGPVIHVMGRYTMTRRRAGVICAIMNGLLTGSSLVPLHYAKLDGINDMSYFVSFSSGAMIANVGIWALYFVWKWIETQQCNMTKAWNQLPKFHVTQLWQKMIIAGVLLSGGQLGAILATSSLGQAVGNSLIQIKILVSGIWGLCVFQEVTDKTAISKWFGCALLSVGSILWLTYERRVNEDELHVVVPSTSVAGIVKL